MKLYLEMYSILQVHRSTSKFLFLQIAGNKYLEDGIMGEGIVIANNITRHYKPTMVGCPIV